MNLRKILEYQASLSKLLYTDPTFSHTQTAFVEQERLS